MEFFRPSVGTEAMTTSALSGACKVACSIPVFSPDSKNIAYVAKEANRIFVVKNRENQPVYGENVIGSPVFSPDSMQIAYIVKQGDKMTIIINNEMKCLIK